MKIEAKIKYKIDGNHPDIGDLPKKYWYGKQFSYEDTYSFDDTWGMKEAVEYIKHDLKLVAGGGYNYDHIYDVDFDIKVI